MELAQCLMALLNTKTGDIMSTHFETLKQYTPPLNPTFSFPKDSEVLDTAGDMWEWQPGYNKAEPTPNDEAMWASDKVEKDVEKYKAAFIAEYGVFKKPFKESTMMVAPVDWRTGYDEVTEEKLVILAKKQGDANEIKNAIGVVNNSIKQTESLLYQVQIDLEQKSKHYAYHKIYGENQTILFGEINDLKALQGEYQTALRILRNDGQVLNQQLSLDLREYQKTAKMLGVTDGFVNQLKKEVGSARLWGGLGGGVGGIVIAGIGLYLLASSRRGAARRTRTTGRGADGLFFRA